MGFALPTCGADAEHLQPVFLYAEAGLSFHRRNHGVEVADVELRRLIAPLADNVMTVVVRLIAAYLVSTARKAQRIDVATFGQVQLAHQPQRKQEIQRTIDRDRSQRRMVRAAERQQFGAAGLSARLADRQQHGPPRTRVRVTGLGQRVQERAG